MRECGDCNACCVTYEIEELNKWPHQPCKHLCSKGCSIYENRPKVCREYTCAWKESKIFNEDERPDKIGVIFRFRTGDSRGAGFRKCLDAVAEHGVLAKGTKAMEVVDRMAQNIPVIVIPLRKTLGPWDQEGNLLPTAKYVRDPERAHRVKPKQSESAKMKALKALNEFLEGIL